MLKGFLSIKLGFLTSKNYKSLFVNDSVLGTDTCQNLMSDGRFPGSNTWQPYGCMMHKYSKL